MLNAIKRGSYFFSAFLLGYFIYMISLILLKVGLSNASNNLFYVPLGIYLSLSIIKYTKISKEFNINEIELCSKMTSSLKKLDPNITKLQGITLKFNEIEQKIDDLIITPNGIFNIVECDYKGYIYINEDNTWQKESFNKKYELPSPLIKLHNNRQILENVIDKDEIIDVIVMVNDRIDLFYEDNCAVDIIRYDELYDYINSFDGENCFDTEKLYDKLYPLISDEVNLEDVQNINNKILDSRWQLRSRLTAVCFFLILYILNLINLGY